MKFDFGCDDVEGVFSRDGLDSSGVGGDERVLIYKVKCGVGGVHDNNHRCYACGINIRKVVDVDKNEIKNQLVGKLVDILFEFDYNACLFEGDDLRWVNKVRYNLDKLIKNDNILYEE